jgi:hypothetical protein
MDVYTPVALKLHAFGLERPQDSNWAEMELFDQLKRPVRRDGFQTASCAPMGCVRAHGGLNARGREGSRAELIRATRKPSKVVLVTLFQKTRIDSVEGGFLAIAKFLVKGSDPNRRDVYRVVHGRALLV